MTYRTASWPGGLALLYRLETPACARTQPAPRGLSDGFPMDCFPHGLSNRGLNAASTALQRCFVVWLPEILQELGGCNRLIMGSHFLSGQGGWYRHLPSCQRVKRFGFVSQSLCFCLVPSQQTWATKPPAPCCNLNEKWHNLQLLT